MKADLQLVNNRRIDRYTREFIEKIQSYFFDPECEQQILKKTLDYLVGVSLADSAICFVPARNQHFFDQAHHKVSILDALNHNNTFDISTLESWIAQGIYPPHSMTYAHPIKQSMLRLVKQAPQPKGMVFIPIIVANRLCAIYILTKTQKPFDDALLDRIRPAISATVCSIYSVESVESQFTGIDEQVSEAKLFNRVFATSLNGIIIMDDDNKIISNNQMAMQIFDPSAVIDPSTTESSLYKLDIHHFIPQYDQLFKWKHHLGQAHQNPNKLKQTIWKGIEGFSIGGHSLTLNLSVFRYHKNINTFTVLQVQDISQSIQIEEQFKAVTTQLQALTQLVPVGILQVNHEWDCIVSNHKWYEFTGFSEEETYGKGWINAIHPDDIEETLETLYTHIEQERDVAQQIRIVSKVGKSRWVDFSVRVLFTEEQELDGFIGTFTDVTERHISQEKLRIAAQYDSLTGLVNRQTYQDRLEQALNITARSGESVTIFFIDLDGFKDVNDSLGHDTGDALLQATSERMINTLRKTDTVSRFGGDEFVILLGEHQDERAITMIAQKVVACVSQPFQIDQHEIVITSSLGIAQGSADKISAQQLLKNADAALYKAKTSGKNRFEWYSSSKDEYNHDRLMLLNELRQGFDNQAYSLVFQAIYSAEDNQLSGFETLIRFTRLNGKCISPDDFIPLLEESNLIIQLGQWIFKETCKTLQEWQQQSDQGLPYISINVSSKELTNEGFIDYIVSTSAKYGIPAKYFLFEITESVIVSHSRDVKETINQLRRLGFRFAVDDFGTGYSSLSYLQKFPIDVLKIDRSFIDDLSENSTDVKITKAIIALASSFELSVIAEGVETLDALNKLKVLGVNYVQGFYLCKPVSKAVAGVLLIASQSKVS